MNLTITNGYNDLKSGSHSRLKHPVVGYERKSKSVCESIDNSSMNFNGSFTGKSDTAVKVYKDLGKGFWDKIGRSERFNKILKMFEERSVVSQALVALVVAGILRPITNLAMAGKDDREDSIYAASHAIASAVVGFVVSYIVMAPFDKAFRKLKENPKKYLTSENLAKTLGVPEIGKRKLEKSQAYKNISKMAQMIPDSIVMGIPKAMLTIALIPPVLKYVFGIEKKPKNAVKQDDIQTSNNNLESNNFIEQPKMENFSGGKH